MILVFLIRRLGCDNGIVWIIYGSYASQICPFKMQYYTWILPDSFRAISVAAKVIVVAFI